MEKEQIIVKLDNGDKFVYGGDKKMEDLLSFMRWSTPTNIFCEDDRGNKHIFHSSSVKHIYTQKVIVCGDE